MEEKITENVVDELEEQKSENTAEVATEKMEDLGQDLEKSYAYMGNGEYDTDTLLAWEKINKYKETKENRNAATPISARLHLHRP